MNPLFTRPSALVSFGITALVLCMSGNLAAQPTEEKQDGRATTALKTLCEAFSMIERTSDPDAVLSHDKRINALLAGAPTTFTLGGQDAWSLLPAWKRAEAPVIREPDHHVYTLTWTDPETDFEASLRSVVFFDPPAVETRWTFTNKGTDPSALITGVDSVALRIASKENQTVLVTGSGGTSMHFGSAQAGFQMDHTRLGHPAKVALEVTGGRSSAGTLPIFYLEDQEAGRGFAIALGWSGNWKGEARFIHDNATVELDAGVEPVHFRLPPGESVHLPTALVIPFEGDLAEGVNAYRRLLRQHYQGRLGGKPVLPPVSFSTWFTFFNGIHDEMLRELATHAASLGIEYFCIDAGWFTGHFPGDVGSWQVNQERFPDGLEPVGKHVHDLGLKLGLWFEPERVAQNSTWHKEHPELMLGHDLLDLSKPEARQLILDMMSGYIHKLDVNWIRYDFNTNPYNAWVQAEGDDEKGLVQIRYINGLYTLLDELMRRHPNLLIEQCSSGGLRIDLETIRHGHTFWKSDDTYDQTLMRFQETGGNHFLLAGHLNTNYCHVKSQGEIIGLFAGALGFGADFRKLEPDRMETIRQCIKAYKLVRPFLNKDYYPLFSQQRSDRTWDGWQFHDPEARQGCFIIYRPEVSPYTTATIQLRGLVPDRSYQLIDLFTGKTRSETGRTLMAGLEQKLAKDTGEVWGYIAE